MEPTKTFSAYQKVVIAIISLTLFTVVLDFMVISPLGALLLQAINITPAQFGFVVSAYAFSAGISGLLTAGFADKFDRKKLLLFFYCGFILGTLLCGIATTYSMLLFARIITGLFGGVIGSISMAIITDLFPIEKRGRVMGFTQMGFGASQVLGIPFSLYLANKWGWQSPFWLVVAVALIVVCLIIFRMQPVTKHLAIERDHNALQHLVNTLKKRNYRVGFLATALLSIGGFMMMPFGSAFAVNNLLVKNEELPRLFMVAGLGSLVFMPLIGKLSDKVDKYKIFTLASLFMIAMVLVYTNLGPEPLWLIMLLNVLMMAGILGRMVPSTALVTAIPEMQDRGAFMSINTSLQQIAGGIAAAAAGMIVVQKNKFSLLEHYNTLGVVIVCITLFGIYQLYRVNKRVREKFYPEKVKDEVAIALE